MATAPVPVVPVTAAGAPPPPPPAAPSTTHAGWGAVPNLPGRSVTGWYTNAYLAILVYLALPILGAVLCNLAGWQNGVWGILLLTTLVDLWVIFHPWAWGGVSLAAYLRGQPGGEAGLSVSDGLNKAWEWLKTVYSWLAAVILGKQIAVVALAFLPVRGFGTVAFAILAMILLVVIGNTIYSKNPWVVQFFWQLYITITLVLLGYWIIAGWMFPELRQAAAYSVVTSAEQTIRDQNDTYLKSEADKIRTKMEGMDTHLTKEERIAKLSKEEQAIWAKAQNSSFARKSLVEGSDLAARAKNSIAPLIEGAVETVKGAASKPAPATPTAAAVPQQPDPACTSLVREVEYSPGKSLGGVNLGPVTSGRYQILVTGDIEQAFLDTDGKVIMYCPVSPEGKLSACRTPEGHPVGNIPGRPWTDLPAPPAPAGQLLVPGEAYGAAVVHMLGKPLVYYPKMFVEVAEKSHLVADSNVYQNDKNYQGTGVRKYQVFKCSSANS